MDEQKELEETFGTAPMDFKYAPHGHTVKIISKGDALTEKDAECCERFLRAAEQKNKKQTK